MDVFGFKHAAIPKPKARPMPTKVALGGFLHNSFSALSAMEEITPTGIATSARVRDVRAERAERSDRIPLMRADVAAYTQQGVMPVQQLELQRHQSG